MQKFLFTFCTWYASSGVGSVRKLSATLIFYVQLTNVLCFTYSSEIRPVFDVNLTNIDCILRTGQKYVQCLMYISQICAVLNVQLTNMSHVLSTVHKYAPYFKYTSHICPMFMYISQTCLLLYSAHQYIPCLTCRLQIVSYFNICVLLTKLSNFCFICSICISKQSTLQPVCTVW